MTTTIWSHSKTIPLTGTSTNGSSVWWKCQTYATWSTICVMMAPCSSSQWPATTIEDSWWAQIPPTAVHSLKAIWCAFWITSIKLQLPSLIHTNFRSNMVFWLMWIKLGNSNEYLSNRGYKAKTLTVKKRMIVASKKLQQTRFYSITQHLTMALRSLRRNRRKGQHSKRKL